MSTSPLWHRAALLGSTWASLEIIVGSFLHNIRFPLAGTLLAALGVLLLVAGRKIWDEPGLLWRAGIICALMKSLSPSAIILGPMAGIVLESLLLEGATRLLGSSWPGLLLGGALGTSLPLLQKAAGLVITYGTDLARLYAALVETAATALSLGSLGGLELFLMLIVASALLGILASALGVRLAQTCRSMPAPERQAVPSDGAFSFEAVDPAQRFSRTLLGIQLALLPAGLFALEIVPLWLGLAGVLLYLAFSLARYRRLARRIGRPRLWVEFTLVTILAGFFLGNLDTPGWSLAGLVAGASMTLRAAFIIIAFSAISVELRNPIVLHWFIRRGFGELSNALTVAFRVLPGAMRILDTDQALLRHPWRSLAHVLRAAVSWVEQQGPNIVVVTGARGEGKTSALRDLADGLRTKGVTLGGILAPAVVEDGERTGYDLLDLDSGTTKTLCSKHITPTGITQGPYRFLPETFRWGNERLAAASMEAAQVLFLDELGPLELSGKGWAQAFQQLLRVPTAVAVITVRSSLLEQTLQHWMLSPRLIWRAALDDPRDLLDTVSQAVQTSSAVQRAGVPLQS